MVILFGLAGSGKSTQGKILAKKQGMEWLSVGQVLRNTGEFDEILKAGELVDDDKVIELMRNAILEIRKTGKNVILDGFPRDEYQAKWVAKNLAHDISRAVFLEVPKEELWARIEVRGRADDTKEAIERRFDIVEQNIFGILEILEEAGVKISQISGMGSIEEVTERLEKALFSDSEDKGLSIPGFLG